MRTEAQVKLLIGVWVTHTDVLHFGVFIDTLGTALTAQAGVLHTTEGDSRVGHDTGVVANDAEFQAIGQTPQTVRVL